MEDAGFPGTARHCEASPKRSEWEGKCDNPAQQHGYYF